MTTKSALFRGICSFVALVLGTIGFAHANSPKVCKIFLENRGVDASVIESVIAAAQPLTVVLESYRGDSAGLPSYKAYEDLKPFFTNTSLVYKKHNGDANDPLEFYTITASVKDVDQLQLVFFAAEKHRLITRISLPSQELEVSPTAITEENTESSEKKAIDELRKKFLGTATPADAEEAAPEKSADQRAKESRAARLQKAIDQATSGNQDPNRPKSPRQFTDEEANKLKKADKGN